MTPRKTAKLSVENFGPVRSGEVELKPLTIFIGPNNSGKSYMALLAYALYQALAVRPMGPFFPASPSSSYRGFAPLGRGFNITEQSKTSERWLREHCADKDQVLFDELPEEMREALSKEVEGVLSARSDDVEEALRDYFGYDAMKGLVRSQKRRKALGVRLGNDGDASFLNFRLRPGHHNGTVEWGELNLHSLRVPLSDIRKSGMPSNILSGILLGVLANDYWWDLLAAEGVSRQNAYYLPSARSGILQGWQVYASTALQIVRRRIGLEAREIAPFAGVAADFLEILYERLFTFPEQPAARELKPALDILEGQMFNGQVSLQRTRAERPIILYGSDGVELPLQRASSMVAELAPLDLWIKYLLRPGDLLIIDEPEAHLHPENQRNIARVLVRLVRAGVRVICPTHSSVILHQVSNHLLASQADPETRQRLGFTKEDLIASDDVGVYLFDLQPDGTHISSVPIEPEFGIAEDEFVRVAEAIGDETYRLSLTSPSEAGGQ